MIFICHIIGTQGEIRRNYILLPPKSCRVSNDNIVMTKLVDLPGFTWIYLDLPEIYALQIKDIIYTYLP